MSYKPSQLPCTQESYLLNICIWMSHKHLTFNVAKRKLSDSHRPQLLKKKKTKLSLVVWHPVPSLHGKQMGKQWKQWLTLFFWAPKSLQMVIAAMKLKDVYSLESYDQPRQHIKKQRITLSTKVRLVKAMVFPVVMYGCESWTTKKAECPRIDAFELWCWRRFWRIPWTARRSNQSILKKSVLGDHWKD